MKGCLLMMQLDEAIKKRLKCLLNNKGYNTLWDLFLLSGVPKSTINSFWANENHRLPRINTLLHLCEGLGITLREFFDDDMFDDVIDTAEDKRDFEEN